MEECGEQVGQNIDISPARGHLANLLRNIEPPPGYLDEEEADDRYLRTTRAKESIFIKAGALRCSVGTTNNEGKTRANLDDIAPYGYRSRIPAESLHTPAKLSLIKDILLLVWELEKVSPDLSEITVKTNLQMARFLQKHFGFQPSESQAVVFQSGNLPDPDYLFTLCAGYADIRNHYDDLSEYIPQLHKRMANQK